MMLREDLITEISMRTDIPINEVEEVLDHEDMIMDEELARCHKKKCMAMLIFSAIMIIGATVVVYILDRKEKIDVEKTVKKYVDQLKSK